MINFYNFNFNFNYRNLFLYDNISKINNITLSLSWSFFSPQISVTSKLIAPARTTWKSNYHFPVFYGTEQ